MVINWENIERMGPEEIENIRVEVIKDIQVMENSAQIVKEEYDQKCRQMITLEGERKDLQITLQKAKHNIRQKKSDLDILTTKFWQKKR